MKALLIDDQAFLLGAFQDELLAFDSRVALVNVESAQAARQALAAGDAFDFVLLHLQLGAENGFDVLADLSRSYPALPLLAVSTWLSNSDVVRAIHLGAVGFVPKSSGARSLILALQTVALGRIYLPPMIIPSNPAVAASAQRIDPSREALRFAEMPGHATRVGGLFPSLQLTPRQSDVLALLLRGQSNKLIARTLNLSVETIKDHVTAVMRTLKVSSRTQAVVAVNGMSERARTASREPPQLEARIG